MLSKQGEILGAERSSEVGVYTRFGNWMSSHDAQRDDYDKPANIMYIIYNAL